MRLKSLHILAESVIFRDGEYTIETTSTDLVGDELPDDDKFGGVQYYRLKKGNKICAIIAVVLNPSLTISSMRIAGDSDQEYKFHPTIKKWCASSPQLAYLYALDVLLDRFYEAEEIILTDIESTYYYATDVLQRPWPEAEPILRQDPEWAVKYKMYF